MNRFHCCATCQHYELSKADGKRVSRCARLGFTTDPKYQFNCWNPKQNVRRLMEQEGLTAPGDALTP